MKDESKIDGLVVDEDGTVHWTRPLPTVLPMPVHYDSGHALTSWSGELRAVVDNEQFVIRRWSEARGWVYFIEWRYAWEKEQVKPGPLPRRRTGR